MKKKVFTLPIILFFVLIFPIKGNAYSSDPKQFVIELVTEAKKILNSNADRRIDHLGCVFLRKSVTSITYGPLAKRLRRPAHNRKILGSIPRGPILYF